MPPWIATSQWLMSIFGYPMDSWVHTSILVFLSLRAREHRGGDLGEIALKDRVLSQYWASWTPEWIAAYQWLMSIFGYPMDSWVHTGTLVFLSLRAREYTGGDLREIALTDRVWSQYWEAERHRELPRPNGWCPFSGTLWTHESTHVLWCCWVLGQGSTEGAISVKSH